MMWAVSPGLTRPSLTNRVLRYGRGPSGLSRFERDALGQTGVSHVVILFGINDIGVSGRLPEQDASTDAITGGLTTLIQRAEDRDARVGRREPRGGPERHRDDLETWCSLGSVGSGCRILQRRSPRLLFQNPS
ncbi:MAG: hypothetical protein ABI895_29660 [Deltaproteobacteria bacterium]